LAKNTRQACAASDQNQLPNLWAVLRGWSAIDQMLVIRARRLQAAGLIPCRPTRGTAPRRNRASGHWTSRETT
jgi:hypothetical protein